MLTIHEKIADRCLAVMNGRVWRDTAKDMEQLRRAVDGLEPYRTREERADAHGQLMAECHPFLNEWI